MIWLMWMCVCASASNTVRRSFLEYEGGDAKLLISCSGLSNEGMVTTVGLNVECSDLPFSMDSVRIVVCDTVYSSLEPFVLVGMEKDVVHKRVLWSVDVEFPQLFAFSENDMICAYTSEGVFKIPLTNEGRLQSESELLAENFASEIERYEHSIAVLRLWCVLAFVALIGCVVCFWLIIRKKSECRRALQEEVCAHELRIENLYHNGFGAFNDLCNVYFDKYDSERTRATIVGDVEDIIMSYRSQKMISELTEAVNANMGGILNRICKELPELSDNDVLLMTYLYAGFSAKAVCLMMDLKLKNFYNRRTRLKDKILASDAQNKEWFASKM